MDNRVRACFIFALALLPAAFAQADDQLPAGIAPASVWLSDEAPSAGDTVSLTTVVYDGSATAVEGSVTFLVDDAAVGSAPFSLEPGDTRVLSAPWTAIEGPHAIQAKISTAIEKDSKRSATLRNGNTGTLAVSIKPPKETAPATEASSSPILPQIDSAIDALASTSPAAAAAVRSVIGSAESVRTAGEEFLAAQANPGTKAATTTPRKGSVLGAETEKPAPGTPASPSLGSRVAGWLLPVFKYPAIFYPVVFIIAAAALWVIAKRLRNPNQRSGRRR